MNFHISVCQTRLEKLARDKHSVLLQKFVTYCYKKLYWIGPWGQCYKTLHIRNLRFFVISQSACPWQDFLTDQARSLTQSGTPERCFTWVGSSLTHKHQTMLEKLARDKHSSLLRKFVKLRTKNFYNIGPWCRFNVEHRRK